MADNVGSVKWDASLDTTKLKSDARRIEGDLDSVASKGNDTFSKIGSYAKAGMIVATTAVAAGTVKMLGSMAELEQQLGGSDAVFGQFSDSIKKDAAKAYRTAGLSQSEFLQGANKMGSLFQGAGVDVKTSMDLSSKAMTRASDVASIMGIDTKFALESVAGAAKGNFTMMDNLGVKMDVASLSAYALQKNVGKTYDEMSQAEKVQLAMQMFLETTAKYAGNYAKENDTLAGSLNTTKKAFSDWLAGAGSIGTVLDNAFRTLGIAGDTISTRFPALLPIIDGMRQGFQMVGDALGWMWQQFKPTFDIIAENKPLLEFLGLFFKSLAVIVGVILTAAFGVVLGAVVLVIGIFELMRKSAVFLGDAIYNTATFFINAWRMITAAWGNATSWFGGVVNGIIGWFARLPGEVGAFAQRAWKGLVGAFSGAVDIGRNIISGIVSGLNPASIIQRMKEIASSALGAVKSFLGIHSPSRVFRDQVGKQIGAGMALGISDSSSLVSNSALKLSNGLLGTFDNISSPTLGIDGTGSLSGSGGKSVEYNIQNINISSEVDGDRWIRRLTNNTEIESSGLVPTQRYA